VLANTVVTAAPDTENPAGGKLSGGPSRPFHHPASVKSSNKETQRCAIEHGDFDSDPELNRMLESKAIKKSVVASFTTFGTSRVWINHAEVASYRDLILREIGDDDRWRGRRWVLAGCGNKVL
jgi:hypothetical protein